MCEVVSDRFWNHPADDLLTQLSASPAGLTETEARRRLKQYGANDPSPRRQYRASQEILRLLLNPLVLILLVASGISAALGDHLGSAIVLVIVLISLILDFYQTHRSETAAQRLAQMIATTATVRRDGKPCEIPFRELVPGDVIALSGGDLVPADSRLLKSHFFAVNEAALTGESLPVDKEARDLASPVDELVDVDNAVFLGSSVVGGSAEALVVKTGVSTQIGHVGSFLYSKPPPTGFEHGMRSFAGLVSRTVAILVLFVFFVNAWVGRDALESFLFAIALAVGLTPEFMPMIVTVTLGEAALRMAKKQVIVRHLQAIQNLGAVDILCSDKTGTLTEGNVQVAGMIDPFGSNPDTLAEMALVNATLVSGFRNSLDEAICRLPDHSWMAGYQKVDEIPFDFTRRRVSVVARRADGRYVLVTKGAPESVLSVCAFGTACPVPFPLTEANRKEVEAAFRERSTAGYRSLAIAYRDIDARESYGLEDERDLTFLGLVCFEDPPRTETAATIQALKSQGVTIKILTGDDPLIARHVCERVGLPIERVLTGPEIDRLGDVALGVAAEKTSLFARLTPIQKSRIIGALKSRGHVVGFLGDGINDAPSLHLADVGISVPGAADVAREAAEVILLERNLAVLHDGIAEGRKSFGNISKYIMMGTSSNFGNMFSMAGATIFLPFLPLLPVQILLNNLLYDVSQITLPTDDIDPELLTVPRKWDVRLIRNFMLVFGPISSLFDYLTFGVLRFAFHATPEFFRTGWFMESLATQVLVIYVIRTIRPSWRTRPSRALIASTLLAVVIGLCLPLTGLGRLIGFEAPTVTLYVFVALAVVVYLGLVEIGKRWFYRRHSLAGMSTSPRFPP